MQINQDRVLTLWGLGWALAIFWAGLYLGMNIEILWSGSSDFALLQVLVAAAPGLLLTAIGRAVYDRATIIGPMPWFYNWLWWVGFAWFVGVGAWAATRPENQNAGTGIAMLIIAVAFAPIGALWCWKRLRTGSWI